MSLTGLGFVRSAFSALIVDFINVKKTSDGNSSVFRICALCVRESLIWALLGKQATSNPTHT